MSDKPAGGCACNRDPFASLPPELRPRKDAMSGLRKVVCPVCGLNYWTNRDTDVCSECEERRGEPSTHTERRQVMLQVQVFGPTPPCANCKRAEELARKAAARFPGQVEVVKLDALGPEADKYGIISTPLVVVGGEVVGMGKVVPVDTLVSVIEKKLGG